MINKFAVFALSFWFLNSVAAQQKFYPPKDETNTDPTLAAFVKDLKKAVEDRDQTWITQALADDAESGFDSENSKTDFINTWSIENDSSDFWLMVSRVINMGGIFLHDTADHTGKFQFVFPYAYAIDLNSDEEYYNIGLITGYHVNLRARPDLKSKVVAQLNYDMVRFMTKEPEGLQITSGANGLGEPEWYKVETYGKDKSGWVSWKFVYNMMGPRLFLYKEADKQWKISALLTGD